MEKFISKLKIYFQSSGPLYAIYSDSDNVRGTTLASFIQGDIQASLKSVQEMLNGIAEIQAGIISEWEETGNAFTVIIRSEEVTIKNAIPGFEDEPIAHFSVSEFKEALELTISVIKSHLFGAN